MPREVIDVLMAHDWPGNVRELENYIERSVVLSNGGPITPDLVRPVNRDELAHAGMRRPGRSGGDLAALIQQLVQTAIQSVPADQGELYERVIKGVERELIEQVLVLYGGVHVKAAERLGINRNTLHNKVDAFNSKRPTAKG